MVNKVLNTVCYADEVLIANLKETLQRVTLSKLMFQDEKIAHMRRNKYLSVTVDCSLIVVLQPRCEVF